MIRFALLTLLGAATAAPDTAVASSFETALRALQTEAPGTNTVIDVIGGEPDLFGLTSVVGASGIADALDPSTDYTIFAPTDEAFSALEAAAPELFAKLTSEPSWNAHLSNLLAFHVTAGAVRSTDLSDGLLVTMLNGEDITIGINDDGVSITSAVTTNASVVTEADLEADNGVVHKVNGVLLPNFVGTDLLGLANTSAGANFQTLFTLINAINLGPLLDTAGDVTVLAPTDEAFAALGEDTIASLTEDRVELTRILANHVLQGIVPSSAVTDGLSVKPLGENELFFSVQDGAISVNGATVTIADVLANNGIVHAIDRVLVEPFDPGTEGNTTDFPSPAPDVTTTEPAPVSSPTSTSTPTSSELEGPELPTAPSPSKGKGGKGGKGSKGDDGGKGSKGDKGSGAEKNEGKGGKGKEGKGGNADGEGKGKGGKEGKGGDKADEGEGKGGKGGKGGDAADEGKGKGGKGNSDGEGKGKTMKDKKQKKGDDSRKLRPFNQ